MAKEIPIYCPVCRERLRLKGKVGAGVFWCKKCDCTFWISMEPSLQKLQVIGIIKRAS